MLEHYIWFEKHRPKTLGEMSLKPEYKAAFEQFIADGNIPHLLLEGTQGSGKTTVANILMALIPCKKLLLNASGKDRGIDTVRTDIVEFAKSMPPAGKIKIVFLDEADALTPDAQTALRNTMETYSKNCKFILTCNYVDKIIKPLQSRCFLFTFNQFPKKKLVRLCNSILRKEGIEDVPVEDVAKIVDKHYPDVRSVINTLQSACLSGNFDAGSIALSGADPAAVVDAIKEGSVFKLRSILAGNLSFMHLYRYLFDFMLPDMGDDAQKADAAIAISEALAVDNVVPDREINFVACCINLMGIMDIQPNFAE